MGLEMITKSLVALVALCLDESTLDLFCFRVEGSLAEASREILVVMRSIVFIED